MIGAGLIKLRGDPCWRDLTCLYYHYETQPIPNPISRYLHFAPHWFHQIETAWNHFIELIVPWFSFGPRHARHVAGVLLVSFQIILIISGNLSFLNYVTIIPFLACFDDTFWRKILPNALISRAQASEPSRVHFAPRHRIVDLGCLPEHRAGDQSRFRAAGNEYRLRSIRSGQHLRRVRQRRPRTPRNCFRRNRRRLHHRRHAMERIRIQSQTGRSQPASARSSRRINRGSTGKSGSPPWPHPPIIRGRSISSGNFSHNDPGTLSLLANNPFPNAPPHYIRARLYRYQFAPLGDRAWWKREPIGEWLPALSVDDPQLRRIVTAMDWTD